MATYDQICKDVMARHRTKFIQDCWIAHVKELNGLKPRQSHNRQSADVRVKPCPSDMRPLIEASMRRFGMI